MREGGREEGTKEGREGGKERGEREGKRGERSTLVGYWLSTLIWTYQISDTLLEAHEKIEMHFSVPKLSNEGKKAWIKRREIEGEREGDSCLPLTTMLSCPATACAVKHMHQSK